MNSICDGRKELFHQQMWYIPSPIIYFCIPNIHSFTWDIYGFLFTSIHKHQLKFFWVQMPSVPSPIMVLIISKTGSNSHNGISQTRGEVAELWKVGNHLWPWYCFISQSHSHPGDLAVRRWPSSKRLAFLPSSAHSISR